MLLLGELMSEQRTIVDEIKQVIDITSRVDERMKIIAESQQQLNIRLNHFVDEHNALVTKVQVLDSRTGVKLSDNVASLDEKYLRLIARLEVLETMGSHKEQKFTEDVNNTFHDLKNRMKELESHKQGTSEKVKQILGFVYQGMFIVIIAYLLYKLGLSNPPG